MTFTFKDNRFAVNEFAMGAEGFVSMKEDMEMDVQSAVNGCPVGAISIDYD